MFKNGAFERTSAAKPFGFPALPLPLALVVAVAALSRPMA